MNPTEPDLLPGFGRALLTAARLTAQRAEPAVWTGHPARSLMIMAATLCHFRLRMVLDPDAKPMKMPIAQIANQLAQYQEGDGTAAMLRDISLALACVPDELGDADGYLLSLTVQFKRTSWLPLMPMLPSSIRDSKPLNQRDTHWLTFLRLAGQVERQGDLRLAVQDRPDVLGLGQMLWTRMIWGTQRNHQHHRPLLDQQRASLAGQEARWAEQVRAHLTTIFRLQRQPDSAQSLSTHIALLALLEQYSEAQE
ncbi:hypothetical protein [Deinococcus alpinitundrae]|uniref:hypothetical protein n=1 Tax=Deinococcus alpinitundrae TaxID=468913 RepID=UPI0013796BB9|nr:hypothetical protein [Deinococcus alpinitundrae]